MRRAPIDRLDARLDGVGHLLADRYIQVPPYQRPYSWTEEQISDLLRDLADAIRDGHSEYFLGTVVLTKNADNTYSVIDGQQRLATVSILIAAIRNYFATINDKERFDGIHQKYLARIELRDLAETAHLKLIAADNSFFEKEILNSKSFETKSTKRKLPVASHSRLEIALKLCSEHVSSLVKQTQTPAKLLFDWIDFLQDKAKVIVLEVNDEAAAYTIFEVLNDRGLDLTVSDLLKNFVFRMAEDKVGEAKESWTSMVALLEGSATEDKALRNFIRHAWSSRHGLTREKELYDRIRVTVDSKQRAVDFARELFDDAKVYGAFDNPADEMWKSYGPAAIDALESFLVLKAMQNRPLLLAIVRCFEDKEAASAIKMLLNWTVRFQIAGTSGSGQLEAGYSERTKDINAKRIKTAGELYRASQPFLTSDAEFETAFLGLRASNHQLARFYLRALEAAAIGTTELIVNANELAVTLEHIMPQKREPHWLHISRANHDAFYKRFGNLILLDKKLNEAAGNQDFAGKKVFFARSQLALTREVAAASSWDLVDINARQEKLAKLAVKAWPLKPKS